MYDLIIIGGGPAGISAGVYASRKKLRSLLVTPEWGGQSTVSPSIENWIGTISISGQDLANSLKEHLLAYAKDTVDINNSATVTHIAKKDDGGFIVTLSDESTHEAKAVLITSGSKRRRLPVPGADEFEHKGLTYCATCDGPVFAGQDVAVIGGGNAGFETAAQLLEYTKSVTLFQSGERYKADPVTVEKVLAHPNMTGILNANIKSVTGSQFVNGITYSISGGEEETKEVGGIFVEIGMVPNTDFVTDLLELDDYKRVVIDPWTQQTSVPGIWAAGDCTNVRYHQNNISSGDAVRALEDIFINLRAK